jgi:hypothetical protein
MKHRQRQRVGTGFAGLDLNDGTCVDASMPRRAANFSLEDSRRRFGEKRAWCSVKEKTQGGSHEDDFAKKGFVVDRSNVPDRIPRTSENLASKFSN